jgi:hypothetical protein
MVVDIFAKPGGWVDEEVDDPEAAFADMDPDIHLPPAGTGPRFDFMILGRDWATFCTHLALIDGYIPGFGKYAQVGLHLNAYPDHLPPWKAPIGDYFTRKTQETLLKPFRTHICSFENVALTGSIDADLAQESHPKPRHRHSPIPAP